VTVPLTIYGGAGSDTIYGGSGGDTIYGGAASGNMIQGGSGGNTIYGGAGGGDTITAGSGGDTIYGGAGGGNLITGGDGGDTIVGGAAGGDTILGGSGDNTITGQGTVSNTITAGDGNNTVYAGSGGDTITLGNGNNQVFGGAGNDTITAGDGSNWLQGNGGCNQISGSGWIYNNTPPGYSAGRAWYAANDPATYVDDVWDSTDGGHIYDPNASEQDYGYVIPNGIERITLELGSDPGGPRPLGLQEIYARWDNTATPPQGFGGWTGDTWYEIAYGVGQVATVQVHEDQTCPGDPWYSLGVFPADATVKLLNYDPSDSGDNGDGLPIYLDAVMFRQLNPVASISVPDEWPQPAETPADTGQYAAWQDTWRTIAAPSDASGQREEIDLHAAVDAALVGQSQWQAELPAVSGLEFWTAAQGGTQLTPDANGNLIDQVFSSTFAEDVWVSSPSGVDPTITLNAVGTQATPGVTSVSTGLVGPRDGADCVSSEPAGNDGTGTWTVSTSVATVAQKQYHVVISDFGLYPGVSANTSQTVASAAKSALAKLVNDYNSLNSAFGQLDVKVDILGPIPVAWAAPPNAIASETGSAASPIDFWLALGENKDLAPGGFVVEKQADNLQAPTLLDIYNNPGNGTGGLPHTTIQLPSNNAAISAFLQDLPTSTDAGHYICDEMAYDLYSAFGTKVRAGAFVHVSGSGNLNAIGATLALRILWALMVE
jgi:hypothetical protein